MSIDWFTVAAQMINFLILVWLLKRFLYGPLLQAMEGRQQRIDRHLAEIAESRRTAEEARKKLAEEAAAFERLRDERLRAIDEESLERRKHQTEELRLEIDTLRRRWQGALTQEQESFSRNLASLAQRELIDLAGKIAVDLADARLESLIVSKFIRRLREDQANPAPAVTLAGLQCGTGQSATVRSSFPLSVETAAQIEIELKKQIAVARIEFQVVPEIGCGIELSLDHHKLSWTIAEYVASFQASMDAVVQQKADATS